MKNLINMLKQIYNRLSIGDHYHQIKRKFFLLKALRRRAFSRFFRMAGVGVVLLCGMGYTGVILTIRGDDKLAVSTGGVDYIWISPASSTGVAAITVRKEDGANQIVISPGANFTVSISDVEKAKDILLMSKVVVCQLEIPLEATYHSLRIAKENNVLTIFNPAPIPDCGLNLSEMPPVDIFCPNESEASLLTKIHIKTVDDAIETIKYFFIHFSDKIRWPMITLGPLGVVYGESENKTIHYVSAPSVDAIDSTGAGDCFIGSLAYYFAKCPDLSLNEKVKRSVYLASKSVEKLGTQTSFSKDLDAFDFKY